MKPILAILIGVGFGPFLVSVAMLAALWTGWPGYPGWGGMAVIASCAIAMAGGILAILFNEEMAR